VPSLGSSSLPEHVYTIAAVTTAVREISTGPINVGWVSVYEQSGSAEVLILRNIANTEYLRIPVEASQFKIVPIPFRFPGLEIVLASSGDVDVVIATFGGSGITVVA
jgi:hypothetical protein